MRSNGGGSQSAVESIQNALPRNISLGGLPATSPGNSGAGNVPIDVCMGSCTVNEDCGGGGGANAPGCACKILSSTYDDRSSTQYYTAACRDWNLVKRSEELSDLDACACNTTYVSHACCKSSDGRVWEHPSKKLGRLWDADDI